LYTGSKTVVKIIELKLTRSVGVRTLSSPLNSLVPCSSKAVHKTAAWVKPGFWHTAPDPRFRSAVELPRRDSRGLVNLFRIGKGLSCQYLTSKEPPPSLLLHALSQPRRPECLRILCSSAGSFGERAYSSLGMAASFALHLVQPPIKAACLREGLRFASVERRPYHS
jgi:hypothetical protein